MLELDKVVLGDCIEGMKELPDGFCHLLIADPPYGINFTGTEGFYGARKKEAVVDGYAEVDEEEYLQFSRDWIRESIRCLDKTGAGYIVSGWSNLESVLSALREAGVKLTNHVIWRFPFGVFTKRKYTTSHYHILYFRKDKHNYTWNAPPYTSDVWDSPRNSASGPVLNANALPYAIVSEMVKHASNPGDVVFDPFMGSGTTARVAGFLGRRFYGFEINEKMWKHCTIPASKTGGLFK